MKLSPRQRRWGLFVLLLTLLAAGWVSSDEPQGGIAEVRVDRAAGARTVAASAPRADAPELDLERLRRGEPAAAVGDPFKARSWEAAAQEEARKLSKPEPPPPPVAPPLPFAYMGKLIENGQLTVFLSHQNRSIIARAGDTIDNLYRVDEITPESMVFVYLPLEIRQQLRIGAMN